MNFEDAQNEIEGLDQLDGFSPADLLDFPSPVVEILRNLMSRRVKGVDGLSAKLQLPTDQVHLLLEQLMTKGLITKAGEENDGQALYQACLKS